MGPIPMEYERSEFIPDGEILKYPCFNRDAVDTIKIYAHGPADYPLFLLGRRGLGKTFIAKRAKAELAQEGIPTALLKFVDGGFIDVDTGQAADLGDLRRYKTIMMDDVHYWLEHCANHPDSLNQNLQLIKSLYKMPKEEGVTSVFVSEFPLGYYEPRLKSSEYGEIVDGMERSPETGLIQREVGAPTIGDMENMVKHYGIPYSETSIKILHAIKPNHRAILRIARLFRDLRYDTLREKALMILERKLKPPGYAELKRILETGKAEISKDSEIWQLLESGDTETRRRYTEVVLYSRRTKSGLETKRQFVLTGPFEQAFYDIMNYGLESPAINAVLETAEREGRSNFTREEDEFIRDNYKKMTDYEIAKSLNRLSRSSIWNRRNRLGLLR